MHDSLGELATPRTPSRRGESFASTGTRNELGRSGRRSPHSLGTRAAQCSASSRRLCLYRASASLAARTARDSAIARAIEKLALLAERDAQLPQDRPRVSSTSARTVPHMTTTVADAPTSTKCLLSLGQGSHRACGSFPPACARSPPMNGERSLRARSGRSSSSASNSPPFSIPCATGVGPQYIAAAICCRHE